MKGDIVWYELMTSDPKGAIAFYTEVIAWKTQRFDGPGDYTMWVGKQGPLGGVTMLPDKARQMGAPPHWMAHVQVPNVDESAAQVKKLGGQIYVSETVPSVGKFAVVADPQSAVISLFTPESAMVPHDRNQHGEIGWHELYTTDNQAAFTFYSEVCGWQKLAEHDMGPMGRYLIWGLDGKQLGGMLTMPPGMKSPDGKPVPPSWMYYVTVTDFDAALTRATSKGARVINGPMPVPGGQRIVQMIDPQGAVIALVTPAT